MTISERVLDYLRTKAPDGVTNLQIREALGLAWPASVWRVTLRLAREGILVGHRSGREWLFRLASPPLMVESDRGMTVEPVSSPPVCSADASASQADAVPDDSHRIVEAQPPAPVEEATALPDIPSTTTAASHGLAPALGMPAYSMALNSSTRSQQARWVVPLLEKPGGRTWLLRRLGCPVSADEATAAEVYHLCYPLRDLFLADCSQSGRRWHPPDALLCAYNLLLGLPESFGLEDLWRTRKGRLRLPWAGGNAGWSNALLERRVGTLGLRRRARRARRLFRSPVDVLLVTKQRVLLVECRHGKPLSPAVLKRLRALGGVLERRLGVTHAVGAIVQRAGDLGGASVPHVLWEEIRDLGDHDALVM